MQDISGRLKTDLLSAVETLLGANRRIEAQAGEVVRRATKVEVEALEQRALLDSLEDSIDETVTAAFNDYQTALAVAMQKLPQCRDEGTRVLHRAEVCAEPHEFIALKAKSAQIRAMIEESSRPIARPVPQDEFVPPFAEATFVIRNFQVPLDDPKFVCTDGIMIYGNVWRLKVYPQGHMDGEGRWVSIFVESMTGPLQPGSYDYRVEMQSRFPHEGPVVRMNRSEFIAQRPCGWNKAIQIEKVRRNGFLDEDGGFTVQLKLRPADYYQAYTDVRAALVEERKRVQALTDARVVLPDG
jgi:hypothetical protein